MNQAISDFTAGRRIAIAGASRDGKGFGNSARKELISRGYEVFPVNPHADVIDGAPCYPSLAALAGQVDGVLVCVPPEEGGSVLREAASVGIRNIWLQQGAESPELIALAETLGLNAVSGKCILMYAAPVRGFHNWHRAWVKLTGKL